MAAYDNQLSYWQSGQLVTAVDMNSFSQDVYARLTDLTQIQSNTAQGVILSLASLSQSGSDVLVGAGSFRFPDANYLFLTYNTGIFANADAATIPVTGNGYVIARYDISPQTSGETNYSLPAEYMFVTTLDTTTDCVICVITAGVISSYGRFNYFVNTNDNPIDGSVVIGDGTIKNGIKTISISNAPISGDTPTSSMMLFLQGAYTHAQINATNGIANNYANIQTTYVDGGNGVFKPYNLMRVSDPAGYFSEVALLASGSGNAYEGFDSHMVNKINNTNYAVLEMYPVSGDPFSDWYLNSAGTQNTGLALEVGKRPAVLGDLNTLGVADNTVTVYGEFDHSFVASGYQKLPGGLIIQGFDVTLPVNTSSLENYPIPFTTGALWVAATIEAAIPGGDSFSVGVDPFNATQASVKLISSAVSGSYNIHIIAIGY